jgi:hypothetical protein
MKRLSFRSFEIVELYVRSDDQLLPWDEWWVVEGEMENAVIRKS